VFRVTLDRAVIRAAIADSAYLQTIFTRAEGER
jgi:hypothetical protein